MLKVERLCAMNFENAIRGARNPMNSWDRSDSYYDENGNYILGENDLSLAVRLARAGSDHRKYLRQIFVSVDITAPLYWWKEFDTYKVGTVCNSCSTMHKIHEKEFTFNDFSCEHLNRGSMRIMEDIVETLNIERNNFLHCGNKWAWWQLIQLLPTSYNQKRTIMLNYEVLCNIYHSRKNHKLTEWHTLCDWIRKLPYFDFIIGGVDNGKQETV